MNASLEMNVAARQKQRELRLRHWKRWLSPETCPKAVIEERLHADRPLADWAIQALRGHTGRIRILDLASGPLTAMGGQAADLEVEVIALDDLAQALNKLLETHGLEPPVPVQFGNIEDVLPRFGPASFDLIYSFSGLDFTDDPIACYRQLISCLRPGGAIITFHEVLENPVRLENEWFRFFHLIRNGRVVIGQRGYFRDLQDALPEVEVTSKRQGSLVRLEIRAAEKQPPVRLPEGIESRKALPPIHSIHIPKTAGSSFKSFLEDMYQDSLFCHYEPDKTTFDSVQTVKLDPRIRCLHGHFQAGAFDQQLPNALKLTWVRDPIERLVSCYFQFHRHPESAGESAFNKRIFTEGWSLMEFARQSEMQRQVRWYFNAVPLDSFFFIGVTERYADSMRLLCHLLGRQVPDLLPQANANPEKESGKRYPLSATQRSELEGILAEEIELYRMIKYRLKQQLEIAFGDN